MMNLDAVQKMSGKSMWVGRLAGLNGGRCQPILIRLLLATLVLSAAWIAQGCSGGSSNSTTVRSVEITPGSVTVPVNQQFTPFQATVTLTDSTTSTTTTVTWEVNGVAGGSTSLGTIAALADDPLEATYTAPASPPTVTVSGITQLGQVVVTAVAQQSTTSTSGTGTVTSNNSIVTVGAGAGYSISPLTPTVAAGGTQQFSSLLNGLADPNTAWTVTPAGDPAVYGSINSSGVYTAPLSPPPGATVTVTGTDPAAAMPASATVTIIYSDRTLDGPYAFSYAGSDNSGFLAAAGSFVSNGQGKIISGVEDVSSFLTGVSTRLQINGTSSTYTIGPDGRGTAVIVTNQGSSKWDFVVTTSVHAQLTRFDVNATGGGSIDQQSLDALTNSPGVITGSYVFSLLGADASFKPLGLAGEFAANGSGGIAESDTILDVNDNGTSGSGVTTSDRTLQGSYEFDSLAANTGRGILTLTSATTGQRQYAFYAVNAPANPNGPDFVTQLHLVEIDSNAFVAGDMYSATGGVTGLFPGNYVFTAGGNSSAGSYASGGVFTPNGAGSITGGVFDANSAGSYNSGPSLSACAYTTDPDATTDRIDLKLFTASGACPAGASASVAEFAVYPTALGTAVMLEIDANALSTGLAYLQCVPPAAACSTSLALAGGSFAIGLTGQGVLHFSNGAGSPQPDLSGQLTVSSLTVTAGTLDINTFSSVSPADPIAATGNSIAAAATNGRGTAALAVSNPANTFNLIYYLIDDSSMLILDKDTTPVAIGIVDQQF